MVGVDVVGIGICGYIVIGIIALILLLFGVEPFEDWLVVLDYWLVFGLLEFWVGFYEFEFEIGKHWVLLFP